LDKMNINKPKKLFHVPFFTIGMEDREKTHSRTEIAPIVSNRCKY